MKNFSDPVRQQYGKLFRRGGLFDQQQVVLVCKKCGERVTLTRREYYRMLRQSTVAHCHACGPDALMFPEGSKLGAKKIWGQADSSKGSS